MPFLNRFVRMLVDGAALTNSTTGTSILHASAKLPLPGGTLHQGDAIKIRAAGRISTLVTSPGTLTIDVKLGSVVLVSTGAMVLSTTAKTNVTWDLDVDAVVRSVGGGTAATVLATGIFTSEAFGATSVAGESKSAMLPASAPAVSSGFDDTAALAFDVVATWSVASASNSIQAHKFDVMIDPGL